MLKQLLYISQGIVKKEYKLNKKEEELLLLQGKLQSKENVSFSTKENYASVLYFEIPLSSYYDEPCRMALRMLWLIRRPH